MKIAIIGHGSIGQRHERLLRDWFGIEPIIVGRNQPIPPHADVAMICTPTDSHILIATECAKRDMALFIEKPLSNSMEGVSELQEIIDKKKLPSYVAYPLRHHEVVQLVKTLNKHTTFRTYSKAKSWPGKRKKDHVLLELSHEIDAGYYIGGKVELSGTCIGNTAFYGYVKNEHKHQVRVALNINSENEIREVWCGNDALEINIDDDLYVRQLEWFMASLDHRMMNAVFEAKTVLQEIMRFIDGESNRFASVVTEGNPKTQKIARLGAARNT